jgi:hypothetical protein
MPPKQAAKTNYNNGSSLGIENELWDAADKLRGHLDAVELMRKTYTPIIEKKRTSACQDNSFCPFDQAH